MPAGYAGPPDPEKGMPFRHTRAKAAMLISLATPSELRAALLDLVYTIPDKVLDALCEVMDEE